MQSTSLGRGNTKFEGPSTWRLALLALTAGTTYEQSFVSTATASTITVGLLTRPSTSYQVCPPDSLSPQQWLTVIRRHWGVETTHQILDGALPEDDRPWVSHSPRLTTVIVILRRIGYTLLAIYKHVTQRSNARRDEPWHVLLSRLRDAMLLATNATIAGLRRRSAEPLPTSL